MTKTVSVIGLGYVGLPSAAVIADSSYIVEGIDTNVTIADLINAGKIHITEPDLKHLVARVVNDGKLRASTKPHRADIFIICVPTPIEETTNKPVTTHVMAAVNSILDLLEEGNLVIIESTCPVGTTRKVANLIRNKRPDLCKEKGVECDLKVSLAYCPERILPGNVIYELRNNDRVVGGITVTCSQKAKNFYESISRGNVVVADSAEMAELAKLAENSYRDVNIAFANVLSNIASKMGVNAQKLREICNLHPRVNILNHGIGVGGHCIAIDPWFLIDAAPEMSEIISVARKTNDRQPLVKIEIIRAAIENIRTKKTDNNIKVKFYGLAYKPDIDDFRESPAVKIVRAISDRYPTMSISIAEPHMEIIPSDLSDLGFVPTHEETHYDLQVILVQHSAFGSITQECNFIDLTI